MLTPRSSNGWIALIVAVLTASTIVTAALAAALTQLLFPNGFLIDVPAPEPAAAIEAPHVDELPEETAASRIGWGASVSCSVWVGDVQETGKPG